MNKNTKLYSVISYLTWIGWAIAYFNKEDDDRMVLHHLNQALVINIAAIMGSAMCLFGGYIALTGRILSAGAMVFNIMGMISAVRMSDKPLPIIGDIHIIDQ